MYIYIYIYIYNIDIIMMWFPIISRVAPIPRKVYC